MEPMLYIAYYLRRGVRCGQGDDGMSATCLSKYPSVSLIAAGRGSVGGRIAHHLDTEGDHSDSCGMDLSYFIYLMVPFGQEVLMRFIFF